MNLQELITKGQEEFDEKFVGNKAGRVYSWKADALTQCTNVRMFLSTFANSIARGMAEEVKPQEVQVPDEKVPFELGIDVMNLKTIIKADAQGYNKALSDLDAKIKAFIGEDK